jgi:cytochrome P450
MCSMTEKVTKVGPYQVPAGVIVFPCLYSILMYSRNWENPQQVRHHSNDCADHPS